MKILAIETSCDETAAAVVEDGRTILSNVINSQILIHGQFGGVVPEVASRKHIENISGVVDKALADAGATFADIDAIAVTYAPGLVGALLVGVSYAKGLAFSLKKPLISVHHIRAHIAANYIQISEAEEMFAPRHERELGAGSACPPMMCLVASGGHSHICHIKDYTDIELLARTRDDAAGEAFDKVARALGLGYPGGPMVSECAKTGNANAISFPRVRMGKECLDFSFSGVKTAVINYLHNMEQKGEEINKADVCASFQAAVVDVLSGHLIEAAKQKGVGTVCLAGGVASNALLREQTARLARESGLEFFCPPMVLCTDNAAMVGVCAYYEWRSGAVADMSLNAQATAETMTEAKK